MAQASYATRKHPSPTPTYTTPCNQSLQHMLRTFTASEYCESIIRQRCGCKITSSDAESSSGPYPTPSNEDVHSIDITTCTFSCARHQQSAVGAKSKFETRKHFFSRPQTTPPAINDFSNCYALSPPANIESPSFGSDVAASSCRPTLRAAVVHIPLLALKMSTILSAQSISNQRRRLEQTSQLASILPLPLHTPTPAINDFDTCYALKPPVNIASPSFGSDVAESHSRAKLRAAVVHIPLVALKMSTVLTGEPLAPAQGISNQRRQLKQTSQLASIFPPPQNNHFNTRYALWPPANIASPSFGSDVAARYTRATLRAAVVHIPLLALKMSTVLGPAQGIRNPRRQHKQTSQLASILPQPPHAPPPAINNFSTCYAPAPPPANIASPSFGSDVAASPYRPTLSDDALVHAPKGAAFTCCAAAMATNMQPVKSRARLLMRKMVRLLMLHALHLLRLL